MSEQSEKDGGRLAGSSPPSTPPRPATAQPKGKRYERDRRGGKRNEVAVKKVESQPEITNRQDSQNETQVKTDHDDAPKPAVASAPAEATESRSDDRRDKRGPNRSRDSAGDPRSPGADKSGREEVKEGRFSKERERERRNREDTRSSGSSYSAGNRDSGRSHNKGRWESTPQKDRGKDRYGDSVSSRKESSRDDRDRSYRDRDRDRDRDHDRDHDRDRDRRDRGDRDRGHDRRPSGSKSSHKDDDDLQVSSGRDLLHLLKKKPGSSSKSKPAEKDAKEKARSASELEAKVKAAADLEAQWQKEEEEKRRKEEEEKAEQERLRKEEEERKAEEERIRQEEEKKRQEEEEAQRIKEEEIKSLNDFISETSERNELKKSTRTTNLHATEHRPDEAFFTKLDSSLKKNTAFVRKLKNLTELQKDSLTKDFSGLNLSKYIGEAAVAITEAKLKMVDIPCALHVCSLMHQRYVEFGTALLEAWQKMLPSKKDEKVANPSKLRVDLRFFAELVAVGVFSEKVGLPVLANQLLYLTSGDKDEHANLTIVLSFCKHCGDDYAGLVPRKVRILAEKYSMEIPKSQFLPAERQKACRNLLKEYFTSLCRHLIKAHSHLKSLEKQNRKILQTKGELSNERKETFEAAQSGYQKLLANACSFADTLDEDLPDLPEDDFKSDLDAGLDIFNPKNAEYQYDGDLTLFEDEETRQFYENLRDLKASIPGILYKDSEQSTSTTEDGANDASVSVLEEDLESLALADIEQDLALTEVEKKEELAALHEAAAEADQQAAGSKGSAVPSQTLQEEEAHQKAMEAAFAADVEEDDTDIGGCLRLMLEAFVTQLPNCINRELIDKAATDFCMNLNTKANRKKLVRALFTVQRTRYDLLPFYARLVATLHPCMPDIANDLAYGLKADFKWHLRKKDQINIESKLKTVRFIGELVKFKMYPKTEALHCLKLLLADFSHHNIEMACALLDSCGRFLYRSPDSHHRTKVYLEVMMRNKTALHLDSRYSTMIENAYYYSNPPESRNEGRKERPPIHEYIRKLLYKDLSKVTTEKVLRQIRKLDWDDAEIVAYIVKCLTNIYNVRYNSIHCVANLLAGLTPYHEPVAIQVVDGVLEDLRIGMEINHPKYNQRRISSVKYLGELYNYRMVESAVIFRTLYSFITFGVQLEGMEDSALDPPEHLFRIRLTCVALDTCGQYFDRGSSKKKLDCFLVYFQRYYWVKKTQAVWTDERPFPVEVDYLVKDTLESLRPKLKLAESYEEATASAEQLDAEFRAKIAEVLPSKDNADADGEEDEDEDEDDDGLAPIRESDELDELSLSLSQHHGTDEHSTQDSEFDDLAVEQSSQSHSQSQSQTASQNVEESQSAEDGDDLMESAGEEEEDDQVTVLTGGPKHIECPEDEDFMSAFDLMMTESIQLRSSEAIKVPQMDIAVPMHLRGQKKGTVPGLQSIENDDDEIKFVLMTKKGNKQQFSTLNVPISAEFAAKFTERKEAERAEKERMKRVVLDIHERQEEEDYQEMLNGLVRQSPIVNMNRERRVRYQHPKGAPDADLIFGSNRKR